MKDNSRLLMFINEHQEKKEIAFCMCKTYVGTSFHFIFCHCSVKQYHLQGIAVNEECLSLKAAAPWLSSAV